MPAKSKKKVRRPRTRPKEKKNATVSFSLAFLQYLIESGVWDAKYWPIAGTLVDGLVEVIRKSCSGDARASIQLKAIEKVIRPGKFDLPQNKIEEVANKYETIPQLARGWELTSLMSSLSYVVEPLHKGRHSPSDPVVVRDIPNFTNDNP